MTDKKIIAKADALGKKIRAEDGVGNTIEIIFPLTKGLFDLIVSSNALEHFPKPGAVVNKAWARLRPGGCVVLLFGVESGTPGGRVVAWVEHIFLGARLLREGEYRRFPGLVSVHRFSRLTQTLAVLYKPEQPT